jgi:hypothetical protein
LPLHISERLRTKTTIPDAHNVNMESTSFNHRGYARARCGMESRRAGLISDALPYSPLWYRGTNAIRDAIGHANVCSRSHDAVIRIYDDAGNVIETHEHTGEFRDW